MQAKKKLLGNACVFWELLCSEIFCELHHGLTNCEPSYCVVERLTKVSYIKTTQGFINLVGLM
jgi:hypothetical protein